MPLVSPPCPHPPTPAAESIFDGEHLAEALPRLTHLTSLAFDRCELPGGCAAWQRLGRLPAWPACALPASKRHAARCLWFGGLSAARGRRKLHYKHRCKQHAPCRYLALLLRCRRRRRAPPPPTQTSISTHTLTDTAPMHGIFTHHVVRRPHAAFVHPQQTACPARSACSAACASSPLTAARCTLASTYRRLPGQVRGGGVVGGLRGRAGRACWGRATGLWWDARWCVCARESSCSGRAPNLLHILPKHPSEPNQLLMRAPRPPPPPPPPAVLTCLSRLVSLSLSNSQLVTMPLALTGMTSLQVRAAGGGMWACVRGW
jgi:hypothetical protein